MRFVLVHSPVVGPSTWRWVADALRSNGHEAIVPNLVAEAVAGDPGVFAQAAAEAADSDEDTVYRRAQRGRSSAAARRSSNDIQGVSDDVRRRGCSALRWNIQGRRRF